MSHGSYEQACQHKHGHRTLAQAKDAARTFMRRAKFAPKPGCVFRAYHCDFCHLYHCGWRRVTGDRHPAA